MGGTVRLISASIEPTDSDISTFNRDERVHAVKMRNQIGASDYIQPFVRALLGGTTNLVRQFLTANLATEIGRRDIAVRAGRKAYRTGSPPPEIAPRSYPCLAVTRNRPFFTRLSARKTISTRRQSVPPAPVD
jgi:hypothetical protein